LSDCKVTYVLPVEVFSVPNVVPDKSMVKEVKVYSLLPILNEPFITTSPIVPPFNLIEPCTLEIV